MSWKPWILNPFALNSATEEVTLSAELKDKLIELSEDSSLKLWFQQAGLTRNTVHCQSVPSKLYCFLPPLTCVSPA